MNDALDNDGTKQEDAVQILNNLLIDIFGDDESRLALALGRPVENVHDLLNGSGEFDDDLVMKMRGISDNRTDEADAGSSTSSQEANMSDSTDYDDDETTGTTENVQSGSSNTNRSSRAAAAGSMENDNSIDAEEERRTETWRPTDDQDEANKVTNRIGQEPSNTGGDADQQN